MGQWISVEDRLPEIGESVLASAGNYVTVANMFRYAEAVSARCGDFGWEDERDDYDYPTKFRPSHWVPLPDPPKEPE